MTCILCPIHQVVLPVIEPAGCPEEPATHRPRPAFQRDAFLGIGLISTVGLPLGHGVPPMPVYKPRPKRPTEKFPFSHDFLALQPSGTVAGRTYQQRTNGLLNVSWGDATKSRTVVRRNPWMRLVKRS